MKNFTYKSPASLKDASQLLGDDWSQSIALAGGTDLLNLMKNEVETPTRVVNLKQIKELNKIEYNSGYGLKLGALATIAEIAAHPVIKAKYRVLHEAAREIASPQLGNMGTLGGNLCQRPRCWYYRNEFPCLRKGGDICYAIDGKNKFHCIIGGGPCFIVHPSDMAVALMALDANVTIFDGEKNHTVPISEFYLLPEQDMYRETVLKPGEIVTHIYVPDVGSGEKSGYFKFKERGIWDFAVVSVAVMLRKKGKTIREARVTLGGIAPKPWLEPHVSENLINLVPDEDNVSAICDQSLRNAFDLGQNGYKILLAKNLMKRMILKLAS
ncbi:xanthine dehydrogenase family protein subunit M [candidate division KSB1 bacterium]|nr:xanthine dehydrogenase family protein subunit M [candidate division KSB1 bacterium]